MKKVVLAHFLLPHNFNPFANVFAAPSGAALFCVGCGWRREAEEPDIDRRGRVS